MTDLGEQFKNRQLVELERYLSSTSAVRTTAFDDDDPLPSFWSNGGLGAAKCGADGLAADGAVTPQKEARHALNGGVRLVGAVFLAYLAVTAFDPQFKSSSRSLLPSEPMAATIKPDSLAVQEAVSIIKKTPLQVQKTNWSATLIDYKRSLTEQGSAQKSEARRAESKQLLSRLEAWMNRSARAERWHLVVIDLGASQRRKGLARTSSSASTVLRR
jgi:hypothetical protein